MLSVIQTRSHPVLCVANVRTLECVPGPWTRHTPPHKWSRVDGNQSLFIIIAPQQSVYLNHGIMGSPEPYDSLLSFPKREVQQLCDVADMQLLCYQTVAPPNRAPHPASQPMTGRTNSVVSMELWGRHTDCHCVVDKIVSYLGPDFPLFHVVVCK